MSLQGFPLTVSPQTMLRLAKHSKENGKTYTMNLSAPFLCSVFKDAMVSVLPYVDILFGNESVNIAIFFKKEKRFKKKIFLRKRNDKHFF